MKRLKAWISLTTLTNRFGGHGIFQRCEQRHVFPVLLIQPGQTKVQAHFEGWAAHSSRTAGILMNLGGLGGHPGGGGIRT